MIGRTDQNHLVARADDMAKRVSRRSGGSPEGSGQGNEKVDLHRKLVRKRIASLKPAPENLELYLPVLADDPRIIELAESISKEGLLQPLVVSQDGYILSGHRRFEACKLLGWKTVHCFVVKVRRAGNPDEFLRLLREHNRHRDKTLEEKLREELVSLDAEECHRRLRERREEEAVVEVACLELSGPRRRPTITSLKLPMLNAIRRVLDERSRFLPLTVRAIHYALLNDPPLRHASKPDSTYQNDKASYKALVELLTRARLMGLAPMDAINDLTRPVTLWDVHAEPQPFIRKQLLGLFRGYYRDLMQSQPNHVEVVCEKNIVDAILRQVTSCYGIPQTSGRGYASLPPLAGIAKRYRDSGKEKLVLVLVSHFDPDGEEICHSFARSMRDDFSIGQVHAVKVALTKEQVLSRKLPPSMDAKKRWANYTMFVAEHGPHAYELEALQPEDLQTLLDEAINGMIDTEAYDYDVRMEKDDAAFLEATRRTVVKLLRDAGLTSEEEGEL